MIVNNEIQEHRIQPSMSECLKGKRIADRQLKSGGNVRYQCLKSDAEIEVISITISYLFRRISLKKNERES